MGPHRLFDCVPVGVHENQLVRHVDQRKLDVATAAASTIAYDGDYDELFLNFLTTIEFRGNVYDVAAPLGSKRGVSMKN